MAKNLSGASLESQKADLIHKTMAFKVEKTKETVGLIHSCSRLNGKNCTFDQFVEHLTEMGFTKKLNLITRTEVASFLFYKVEDDNCTKTILEHLSKISSSISALEVLGYQTDINDKEFHTLRVEIKTLGYVTMHKDRAFDDPSKVINDLYTLSTDYAYGTIAELQYICGYRIHEALQVTPEMLEQRNDKCFIKEGAVQGKGGFPLHEKEIPLNLAGKIVVQFFMKDGWDMTTAQYNKGIKTIAGDEYSSHCFRYNYAQELFTELIAKGYSEVESKLTVSEAMGHHRPEITQHYLNKDR